jgi:hypothetical protein
LRWPVHTRRPISRYSPPNIHYVFLLSCFNDEPISLTKAVNFEQSKLWKKDMEEEMEALEKNEAWDFGRIT